MYIINPMTFYWLSVLDALRGAFLVVSILGGAASIIMPIIYFAEGGLVNQRRASDENRNLPVLR